MNKIQSDLLGVNVSWFLEDLELYDGQYGFSESFCFTVARLVTLIMAIIVHRAFYKLMKRLPGRAVNQIIYPYMVRYIFRDIYNIYMCTCNSHKTISICYELSSSALKSQLWLIIFENFAKNIYKLRVIMARIWYFYT